MMVDWLILVPLVVGHLALFVLALNLLHSTNIPEKLLDALNLALLLATLAALPVPGHAGPVDRLAARSRGATPCSAWGSRWSACPP